MPGRGGYTPVTPHRSRQGFGPWAVPLLRHGHPSCPWQDLLPWRRGQAAHGAPSRSARTPQPRRDPGTPQGAAGTQGDPERLGGSGEIPGNQGQARDATEEWGHPEIPRGPGERWGQRKNSHPGGLQSTCMRQGTQRDLEGSMGEPREDGAPRRTPESLQEMGHLERPRGTRRRWDMQRRRGTGGHPERLIPLRGGEHCPAKGGGGGGLTDLGFFLGARLS